MCRPCLLREEYLPAVAPLHWRDKGEELCMPMEHAAYIAKYDGPNGSLFISILLHYSDIRVLNSEF